MKTNRRNFFRLAGLTGLGLAGSGLIKTYGSGLEGMPDSSLDPFHGTAGQTFNMCGYAAPKLETVRVGIIGLGNRGPGALDRMTHIEGVEIKALCDLRPEKVDLAKQQLENSVHKPVTYLW